MKLSAKDAFANDMEQEKQANYALISEGIQEAFQPISKNILDQAADFLGTRIAPEFARTILQKYETYLKSIKITWLGKGYSFATAHGSFQGNTLRELEYQIWSTFFTVLRHEIGQEVGLRIGLVKQNLPVDSHIKHPPYTTLPPKKHYFSANFPLEVFCYTYTGRPNWSQRGINSLSGSTPQERQAYKAENTAFYEAVENKIAGIVLCWDNASDKDLIIDALKKQFNPLIRQAEVIIKTKFDAKPFIGGIIRFESDAFDALGEGNIFDY